MPSKRNVFIREDGRPLRVIQGFRERVLSAPRTSVQPKPEWNDGDYAAAADKKIQHSQKLLSELARLGGRLPGAQILEVGCGAGIDCLLTALYPVRSVVGVDMSFPLFDGGDKGERTRRLTREVLSRLNLEGNIVQLLERLPVRFAAVDAARMAFPDHSFDFLRSRAAMEHIIPIDKALAEMARVVRPGGLIYHTIDPYFWLKGCHKTGVVNLPWAHARLRPDDLFRFVAQTEGEAKAVKRCRHLKTLNQFTLRQWRGRIEAGPFEVLEWVEDRSDFAEALLKEESGGAG